MNIQDMMKQAQQMQETLQKQMAELRVEGLLQDVRLVSIAEGASVGPDAAVAGHLVVLDVLRGGNEAGVEHILVRAFLDEALGLLDQPFHPLALLSLRGDAELLADALEALRMLPGLLLVSGEGALERGVR